MVNLKVIIAAFKSSGSTDFEYLMKELRSNGADQKMTVKILFQEFKFSLMDADRLVVNSSTWADFKSSTEDLRKLWHKVNWC